MQLPDEIVICEVGTRDGLQNEKIILSLEEKVELVEGFADAGFKVIEVGSFMNPMAVPTMASTDDVFKRIQKKPRVEYRALVANLKGIERAINCGCQKVLFNVSISRSHNLANLNRTPEESIEEFKKSADFARESGLELAGSISMPFGSPWEHRIPIKDVKSVIDSCLSLNIREISLSDTSGIAMPLQVYSMVTELQIEYPKVNWILHFHNTNGMGFANVIAGMQAGIKCFDSSIGGLGGCPFVSGATGNIASEDLIHMCDEMDILTGIDFRKVFLLAEKVQLMVDHELPSYFMKSRTII